MNIAQIYKADTGNGIGMRVSLFVSGCTIKCPECFNKEAQDFKYGQKFTPEIMEELLNELRRPFYQGLTILGGEPFELKTQPDLLNLIKTVKNELPDKDIWVYSGNIYNKNLSPGGDRYISGITDEILDNIDVLVDGPFVKDLYDIRLNFRGSKNQRIIDLKKTRSGKRLVLHDLNNVV